jgi:hypothetical protein
MNDQRNSVGFFSILAYSFAFGLGVCLVPLAWLLFLLVQRGKPTSEAKLRQVRNENEAARRQLADEALYGLGTRLKTRPKPRTVAVPRS